MIKALCIAISTYSILPVPRFQWTEDTMRFSLCALPVVGIIIGIVLWLWYQLCMALGLSSILFAAVATAIPLIITGGIHMDGYCDTADALASHRKRKRKLKILKDPHVGAFAIVYSIIYGLVCFGLYHELFIHAAFADAAFADAAFGDATFAGAAFAVVCIGFVLSRSFGVLSAILFKNARKDGMLVAFTENISKLKALMITAFFMVVASVAMLFVAPYAGLCCVMLCIAWFFAYRALAMRQFGGVTGDTTGFYLQITELIILIAVLLGTYVGSAV